MKLILVCCLLIALMALKVESFTPSPSRISFHRPATLLQATSPDPVKAEKVARSLLEKRLELESKARINGTSQPSKSGTQQDAQQDESSSSSIMENFLYLQALGAMSGRGEYAKKDRIESARQVIQTLEGQNPTPQPCTSPLLNGRWELVMTDTQLFRSSPFFQAGRAVCTTTDQAQQFNWFCDMHRKALAISSIGAVRQIVSPTRVVSEFEVSAGAVPFLNDLTPFSYSGGLPVTIDGAIVSTADLTPTSDGSAWELYMDTVEIKGSNLPGVRQVLDRGLKLESRRLGDFLESNVNNYSNPRPIFRTTYLDDKFRISRDQDDNFFVYVKTDESTEPTDYSNVDSDLGLLGLLEGFNDAVTKFYL